ncbi:hypothetical protein [Burkholderia vietnamiensis]|uniref:hypothetical protein n=1 Tax=Burkholderia vietnamiensis TaxID=60552 RepID=UPI001CF49497|nr:hypothetical protein [Burkholderia vietnamiensis]MCA8229254.1 hypothetical protein [Burkholderia vietnamiensis]
MLAVASEIAARIALCLEALHVRDASATSDVHGELCSRCGVNSLDLNKRRERRRFVTLHQVVTAVRAHDTSDIQALQEDGCSNQQRRSAAVASQQLSLRRQNNSAAIFKHQ